MAAPKRRLSLLGTAALAALCCTAAPALAYEPVGSDLQISDACCAPNPFAEAETPSVAYNPATNRYLVAWEANNEGVPNHEIYTQLVGADGVEVGSEVKLSSAGGVDREAQHPAVTYNSTTSDFLVVWEQDFSANDQYEIFGHHVDGTTGLEEGADIPISDMGAAGADRDALDPTDAVSMAPRGRPAIAYNPTTMRYLVAWEGDGIAGASGNDQYDIWGREVTSAGALVGGSSAIVATVEGTADAECDGFNPALAYNSFADEMLIVYEAETGGPPCATNNKFEVWGKVFGGSGAGPFQISSTTGDNNFDATRPAIAYNPATHEYLVVWQATEMGAPSDEIEGHLVTSDEALPLPDEADYSEVGTAGRDAQDPMVAYSSSANEFMVTWEADRDADALQEVFGQRVNVLGGETGIADFQIFTRPSDSSVLAIDHALAYNSGANEYLAVQRTDNPANDEFEIWDHRLALAASPPDGGGGTGSAPPSTPAASPTGKRAAALKKCKRKKSAAGRKKCKKAARKLPA